MAVNGARCRKISVVTRKKRKDAALKSATSAPAHNAKVQTKQEQHKLVLSATKNNVAAAN